MGLRISKAQKYRNYAIIDPHIAQRSRKYIIAHRWLRIMRISKQPTQWNLHVLRPISKRNLKKRHRFSRYHEKPSLQSSDRYDNIQEHHRGSVHIGAHSQEAIHGGKLLCRANNDPYMLCRRRRRTHRIELSPNTGNKVPKRDERFKSVPHEAEHQVWNLDVDRECGHSQDEQLRRSWLLKITSCRWSFCIYWAPSRELVIFYSLSVNSRTGFVDCKQMSCTNNYSWFCWALPRDAWTSLLCRCWFQLQVNATHCQKTVEHFLTTCAWFWR